MSTERRNDRLITVHPPFLAFAPNQNSLSNMAVNGVGRKFENDLQKAKNNSVEIVYISYKNLRYHFHKFAEKINGKVLVPSSHVEAFSETLHENLPVVWAKAARSIDEGNYFV